MPTEIALWRLDGGFRRVPASVLPSEDRLEKLLASDLSMVEADLMLLGCQVHAGPAGRMDILAIDQEGVLVVIELKRDRTPRDVVAQALDYGAWVRTMTWDDVRAIHAETGGQLDDAFRQRFGTDLPVATRPAHRLVIVASELDAASERIVGYLADAYAVPVNVVFFRYFSDAGREFLARSWLLDPEEAESRERRGRVLPVGENAWTENDFFVSLGVGPHRAWEDCVRYGFVSAGHGRWYSRTLRILKPGARVFVHVPQEGYVGVGRVTEGVQNVRDFVVEHEGRKVPILEAPLAAPRMGDDADDPDLAEYLVRVEWTRTLPRDKPLWETGFFANQNSACWLRQKHRDKLVKAFGLPE